MEVLVFGSESMVLQLKSKRYDYSYHMCEKPRDYKFEKCIIIIEDYYDTNERTVEAKEEVIRLRKEYFEDFVIIVNRGHLTEPKPKSQKVLDDPFVKEFSLDYLLETPLNNEKIQEIFPIKLNTSELKILFEDIRTNFYSDNNYLITERHHLLTELNCSKKCEEAKKIVLAKTHNLKQIVMRESLAYVSKDIIETERKVKHEQTIEGIINLANGLYTKLIEKVGSRENLIKAQQEEVPILYVGSRKEVIKQFVDSLDHFLGNHKIKCLFAADEAAAVNQLKDNPHVSIVFTDYRFWEKDGRLSQMNGYILVCRLQRKLPGIQYCFLTYHKGEIGLYPPQMRKEHVFDKNKIISDRDPLETARLITAIFYGGSKEQAADWPVKLNAKIDEDFREMYNEYLLAPDRYSLLKKSNQQATRILNEIKLKKMTNSINIFRHAPLGAIKREGRYHYLQDILTARKVIIGLLNQQNLSELFPEYLNEQSVLKEEPQRNHFDIIYGILSSGSIASKDGKGRVSKFFTETFRILLRGSYQIHDVDIEKYVLSEEKRWLQSLLKNI